MWKDVQKAIVVLMALLLAGCNEDGFVGTGNGNGPTGVASAATLTLLASSPQIGSSGAANVTITAIVKDGNNNLMADIPVAFSAGSGALAVTQSVTDAAGRALATLNPGGDYTNRTITVSATTGSLNQTVNVAVTGTSLAIGGESSATLGDQSTLTITLRDSDNNPIAGRAMTVTSALGNALSAPTLTTNSSGQVQVTVTAGVSGTDTIVASAQGASATHAIVISGDEFLITAPAADATIEIGACTPITVSWQQNGVAVSGSTVNFSTTRGTLYSDTCNTPATTATTNGAGIATLHIASSNAGPGLLSAFVSNNGPSTSRSVNFVASTAATINLQASPTSIGPNSGSQANQQQSTITATVRDLNNNLVAGKVIRFSIVQDNSGGHLTTATATTNLQGRASTTYISSSATTAKDGVVIRAEVDENPSINTSVSLTVAQSALFVRLGTGNLVTTPTSTTYGMPYTVIVTDASGNAAAGVKIDLSVNPRDPNDPGPPNAYRKGFYQHNGSDGWIQVIEDSCRNEDLNMNGILDAGEDENGDLQLTPGNVASVPQAVTTGADGTFEFTITYPRQFANWVHVRLTAGTAVAGTESIDKQDFWLPIASNDLGGNESTPPPGAVSPFGTGPCP